jgi:hypothetical protein
MVRLVYAMFGDSKPLLIALMMEATSTSETSVSFYLFIYNLFNDAFSISDFSVE